MSPRAKKPAPAPPWLDREATGMVADLFRLLGDTTRLQILLAVSRGPLSVGEIAQTLELPQPLVSHHLRLLRAGRLVKSTRDGRRVIYTAQDEHVRCVLKDMVDHVLEKEGLEVP